eukprot:364672-Chlamydomonas_euryale.AAC.7
MPKTSHRPKPTPRPILLSPKPNSLPNLILPQNLKLTQNLLLRRRRRADTAAAAAASGGDAGAAAADDSSLLVRKPMPGCLGCAGRCARWIPLVGWVALVWMPDACPRHQGLSPRAVCRTRHTPTPLDTLDTLQRCATSRALTSHTARVQFKPFDYDGAAAAMRAKREQAELVAAAAADAE